MNLAKSILTVSAAIIFTGWVLNLAGKSTIAPLQAFAKSVTNGYGAAA